MDNTRPVKPFSSACPKASPAGFPFVTEVRSSVHPDRRDTMNSTPEGRGPEPCPSRGVTRRGFLVGAGAGLAVGAPLGWLGLQGWQRLNARNAPPPPAGSAPQAAPRSRFAMPGLFPGRVVEVRHPDSVSD